MVTLRFLIGRGLVVTEGEGSLTSDWAKAYIKHFLEDASTLHEQVMVREINGHIEVKYLFDVI
jgi:hypothetical protein